MEGNWHHVVTVDNLGGLKRQINVTYDTVGTKMAITKASEMLAQTVQIKGFRKGKAPAHIVESFYRREVESQAANMLATEGFLHACYENKIVPLTKPMVQKAEFKIDGSFCCEIAVDQKPTITPVGYIGLEVQKPKISVQEIYEQVLTEQRNNFKKEVQKEILDDSDIAVVDYFVVDKDGKEISSGKEQRFFVRKGQEPPFGENLIGKKIEEVVSGEIALPDNFKDRAGEMVNVSIHIKNILHTVESTDDEIVKELNLQTTEQFYNAILAQAQQEANNRANQILQESVIDKLLEMNEFEVPEEWVRDEEKYIYQQLKVAHDDETFRQYVEGMATRNVKRTFILDSIYDAEQHLAVKQEELEAVIKAEADKKGISTILVKEELNKNNMMEAVIGLIKNRKVMDFILSQAQISEETEENSIPVVENV